MQATKIYTTILLLCFSLFAQAQDFEGTIQVKSSEEKAFNASFHFKGHLAKMETQIEDGQLTLIKDKKSGNRTMLREKDGKKIAIVQNPKKDPRMHKAAPSNEVVHQAMNPYEVILTEEQKMIGEYECFQALIITEKLEATAWLTKAVNIDFESWFPSLQKQRRDEH